MGTALRSQQAELCEHLQPVDHVCGQGGLETAEEAEVGPAVLVHREHHVWVDLHNIEGGGRSDVCEGEHAHEGGGKGLRWRGTMWRGGRRALTLRRRAQYPFTPLFTPARRPSA
eukprot:scaffold11893_cov49-Isochrysis_galbana.AAC.1